MIHDVRVFIDIGSFLDIWNNKLQLDNFRIKIENNSIIYLQKGQSTPDNHNSHS
jgi:hypothetical protein